MGPPPAVQRRVRIVIGIRVLMMFAMSRDPEERSAFEGEGGTERQEIFDRLRVLYDR